VTIAGFAIWPADGVFVPVPRGVLRGKSPLLPELARYACRLGVWCCHHWQRPAGRRWQRDNLRSRLNKEQGSWHVAALIISSVGPDAFGPETVAAMGEAYQAAVASQPNAVHEVIARRIIAAARFGERDPVRLREAALVSVERRSK